jgi:hypothetical protein
MLRSGNARQAIVCSRTFLAVVLTGSGPSNRGLPWDSENRCSSTWVRFSVHWSKPTNMAAVPWYPSVQPTLGLAGRLEEAIPLLEEAARLQPHSE